MKSTFQRCPSHKQKVKSVFSLSSPYVDKESKFNSPSSNKLSQISVSTNSLNILFLNIQGLNNKISILESFLDKNTDIICLSEHWLKSDEIKLAFPDNYYCAAAYCRNNHIRGGTCIFIKNNMQSSEIDISTFCDELNFEASAIYIAKLKCTIVSLYFSPTGDPYVFMSKLEIFLRNIMRWPSNTIIIGGDLNIKFDVTKTSNKTTKDFLKLLKQFNFYHLNEMPTRGKNCLDNVFLNNRSVLDYVSIFKFPFSDHLGLDCKLFLHNNDTQKKEVSLLKSGVCSGLKCVLPKQNFKDISMHLDSYDWQGFLTYTSNLDAKQTFKIFLMFYSIV